MKTKHRHDRDLSLESLEPPPPEEHQIITLYNDADGLHAAPSNVLPYLTFRNPRFVGVSACHLGYLSCDGGPELIHEYSSIIWAVVLSTDIDKHGLDLQLTPDGAFWGAHAEPRSEPGSSSQGDQSWWDAKCRDRGLAAPVIPWLDFGDPPQPLKFGRIRISHHE